MSSGAVEAPNPSSAVSKVCPECGEMFGAGHLEGCPLVAKAVAAAVDASASSSGDGLRDEFPADVRAELERLRLLGAESEVSGVLTARVLAEARGWSTRLATKTLEDLVGLGRAVRVDGGYRLSDDAEARYGRALRSMRDPGAVRDAEIVLHRRRAA